MVIHLQESDKTSVKHLLKFFHHANGKSNGSIVKGEGGVLFRLEDWNDYSRLPGAGVVHFGTAVLARPFGSGRFGAGWFGGSILSDGRFGSNNISLFVNLSVSTTLVDHYSTNPLLHYSAPFILNYSETGKLALFSFRCFLRLYTYGAFVPANQIRLSWVSD